MIIAEVIMKLESNHFSPPNVIMDQDMVMSGCPNHQVNAFEAVLVRWMKLEPIIQNEVNQKEKHEYSILMYIYEIQKDDNEDPMCKTAKETQI